MAKQSTDVEQFGVTALEEMSFSEMMDAGVIDISEIDDVIPVEQTELVGKPFILYEFEVKPSEQYGGTYAICRVKTAEGTRVFADGGVGIKEQLERYKRRLAKMGQDVFTPTYFHFGLRSSTYTKHDEAGAPFQATTFYFDNRPRP